MKTVEIVTFKIKVGIDENKVLEAIENMYSRLKKVRGFIDRELTKKGDLWADIVHWESLEDAQDAMDELMKYEECQKFFSMIDGKSVDLNHFEVKKEFN